MERGREGRREDGSKESLVDGSSSPWLVTFDIAESGGDVVAWDDGIGVEC